MIKNDYPAPIVLEPHILPADACVIWLHGLGADGHDFEGLVPELGLNPRAQIRFIFPTASTLPVTLNMNLSMRAWYDIRSMQLRKQVDWQNIEQSSRYVQQLINQQIEQGIDAKRILLAGFSQGGVVALHTALLCQMAGQTLAGVMALSTYYPEEDHPHSVHLRNEPFASLPILMAHGRQDDICPIEIARASTTWLMSLGGKIDWQEYVMAHQVCMAEIEEIARFIERCLPMELHYG